MSLKLHRMDEGFKVLFDCEKVGMIYFVSPTHYRVTDMRGPHKDKNYASKGEAIRHFTSFKWRSVLGASSLAQVKPRMYEPHLPQVTKQRWARR